MYCGMIISSNRLAIILTIMLFMYINNSVTWPLSNKWHCGSKRHLIEGYAVSFRRYVLLLNTWFTAEVVLLLFTSKINTICNLVFSLLVVNFPLGE